MLLITNRLSSSLGITTPNVTALAVQSAGLAV